MYLSVSVFCSQVLGLNVPFQIILLTKIILWVKYFYAWFPLGIENID